MPDITVEWEQAEGTRLPGGYTISKPEAKVFLHCGERVRRIARERTTGPRIIGDPKPVEGIVETLRDLADGGLINPETFDDIAVEREADKYNWLIKYKDMPWAFSSKDFGPSFTYYAIQALRKVANQE